MLRENLATIEGYGDGQYGGGTAVIAAVAGFVPPGLGFCISRYTSLVRLRHKSTRGRFGESRRNPSRSTEENKKSIGAELARANGLKYVITRCVCFSAIVNARIGKRVVHSYTIVLVLLLGEY